MIKILSSFLSSSTTPPPPRSRLHAHREHRGRPKAPGFSPWGPAGLWGLPAPRGPQASGQAPNDPAPAPSDRHQGSAALLQHQNAGQSPHAQTIPGDVGSQGLTPGARTFDRQLHHPMQGWETAHKNKGSVPIDSEGTKLWTTESF